MSEKIIYDCISITEHKDVVGDDAPVTGYQIEHADNFGPNITKVIMPIVNVHKPQDGGRMSVDSGRPSITDIVKNLDVIESIKMESYCENDSDRQCRIFKTESKP